MRRSRAHFQAFPILTGSLVLLLLGNDLPAEPAFSCIEELPPRVSPVDETPSADASPHDAVDDSEVVDGISGSSVIASEAGTIPPRPILDEGMVATTIAQKLTPWDLEDSDQEGQMSIWLSDPGGGNCGLPVEYGDYDDDGLLDVAIAATLADSGPLQDRVDAGEVYVLKGNGAIAGSLDLASPIGEQPMLRVLGGAEGDLLGTELYSSDQNGDGVADLIIGASGVDSNGNADSGAVYVIYGGADFGGVIDLADPDSKVVTVLGIDTMDRIGLWVESGDFDGDGHEDLMISGDAGDGVANANRDRGEIYVMDGSQPLPEVIDLAHPPADLVLTTIYGEGNRDHLGSCIHSADLDGDGYEEIIGSAALNRVIADPTGVETAGGDGPVNSRNGCGDTYILWGETNPPHLIDLSDSASLLSEGKLTVIYGADSDDYLGEEISSGNLDGDAYLDLMIGALTAKGVTNTVTSTGEAVVIYGGPHLRGQVLDMRQRPAGTCTLIGEFRRNMAGDTLSTADVNGDGFEDLYFGVVRGNVTRDGVIQTSNGEILIMYGGPRRWPRVLPLATMDADTDYPTRRIFGREQEDLMSESMEGADFDGDGFADVLSSAPRADGFDNAFASAGEATIVSGHRFSKGILTVLGRASLGSAVPFHLVGEPGHLYVAAFSLASEPAQPLGNAGSLYLANDLLFRQSIAGVPPFGQTSGRIGKSGRAQFSVVLPNIALLSDTRIYTAYVTIDPKSGEIDVVSATTSFVTQPGPPRLIDPLR